MEIDETAFTKAFNHAFGAGTVVSNVFKLDLCSFLEAYQAATPRQPEKQEMPNDSSNHVLNIIRQLYGSKQDAGLDTFATRGFNEGVNACIKIAEAERSKMKTLRAREGMGS